jgi:transcriptional regulator with XRE-family HTH domain
VAPQIHDETPVRTRREYRAVTHTQLARTAGITVSMISYIESGARKPLSIGDLDIISVFGDVEAHQLA